MMVLTFNRFVEVRNMARQTSDVRIKDTPDAEPGQEQSMSY